MDDILVGVFFGMKPASSRFAMQLIPQGRPLWQEHSERESPATDDTMLAKSGHATQRAKEDANG
jgi:hypothetical protein